MAPSARGNANDTWSRLLVVGLLVVLAGCSAETQPTPGSTDVHIPTPVTPTPSVSHEPPPADVTPYPSEAFVTIAEVDVTAEAATVSGMVTGVVEDGGECVFTLSPSGGGDSVTVEQEGIGNVSTVSCGTNKVPMSDLSRGQWEVVLAYRSATTSATSEPVEMDVP